MEFVVVILFSIVLCSLTIIFSYRHVVKAFDSIDAVLDSILTKDAELPFEPS